ncbi:MAG: SufE family protein [Calditrichaeota bacterium]|nr:MAG: SufE family protein [Calditrichota bacterium]MBL1205119.1 SufE family protein [Calditrichota bacterium]NOG44949.1 SufE family protein [Calditrichota bacterium]
MTIDEKMEEISETFDFLEGLEKMEYVVDMAKKSPGLPEDRKSESSKIYGCMSETWVIVEGSAESISIQSDSEAQIVKGMLHLLANSINGHSKEEILALDEQTVLNKLGLGSSITNRRMNGFASAVLKIKEEIKKI